MTQRLIIYSHISTYLRTWQLIYKINIVIFICIENVVLIDLWRHLIFLNLPPMSPIFLPIESKPVVRCAWWFQITLILFNQPICLHPKLLGSVSMMMSLCTKLPVFQNVLILSLQIGTTIIPPPVQLGKPILFIKTSYTMPVDLLLQSPLQKLFPPPPLSNMFSPTKPPIPPTYFPPNNFLSPPNLLLHQPPQWSTPQTPSE